MAQRTVCLCNGKYIGIETIYTVINGRQINIPEKLKDLRAKSKNNELFCPCGCGSNLILVAGDKNLKEQHFRLKNGAFNGDCNVNTEGKISVDSKIVLKCWLDDKLNTSDIETRVPIQAVDDINRKYEFSFLSLEKKIALSYCYERENLSDNKLDILASNSQGIHIIYIVDIANGGSEGQYPECLIKIQNKQGYCLLLEVVEADYSEAVLEAVFYTKNMDGLWKEVSFAEGKLSKYDIDENGAVFFSGQALDLLKDEAESKFVQKIEAEKRGREERQRKIEEAQKERQRQDEEAQCRRMELEEKRRIEEEKSQAVAKQKEEDFKRNMESHFIQQNTQIRDAEGNRWIKCEFCGKIAKENEFTSYGGIGHINLGTCKGCSDHNPTVKKKSEEVAAKVARNYDPNICPECGERLHEISGPYGRFMGCSNYPVCRYNRRIRQRR